MGSSDAQRKSRGGSMKRHKAWEDGCEQVGAGKKRFVGVRQRPSGRWVAEIKDTTQKIRLWLGTFDSAEEGAKAYDSAARALRGANTRTNFVTALSTSTCESTPSKATRLIRLRQIAAANAKLQAEAARLGHGGADELPRHDASPQPTCSSDSDERRGQVATPPPLLIAPPKPARRENAPAPGGGPEHIEPVASSPHEILPRDTAAAAAASPPPCCNSTSEAAAPATANRETSAVSAFSCSSESSSLHSCATSGASSSSDPVDAMIPWSDYVLVDGLDLPSTCEFAVYASAFDFSAEAMDRDSCTTSDLLEDHTTSLRDSDVDDSTEFPNFAISGESSDMDRVGDVGDAETCSSHDLAWSRYRGRCAAT